MITPLIEAICEQIASSREFCGAPGYVRASQTRELLIGMPSYTTTFLEMLPAAMQWQIQARLSRQETRLLTSKVAA